MFLHHPCNTRGIPNHLGSVGIFEPNIPFRFRVDYCPLEHCIEYMPLPPMTKAQYEEGVNLFQE